MALHAPGSQLCVERRLSETSAASTGIDRLAHMSIGSMDPLPAGGAHERVIVQRRDDGNAAFASDSREIEREIQQVVHVQNVRLGRIQDVLELPVEAR